MSSSRSIAAARNRRANDSSMGKQQAPPPRPGTSIGANAAFNQPPGQARKYVNAPPMPPQQPQYEVQSAAPAKISISDAIGLTTLRLGKLEQAFQRLEQTGVSGVGLPENSQIVDQSVLHSIVSRIDGLEKKDAVMNQMTAEVQFLKNEIFGLKKQMGELFNNFQTSMQDVNNRFADIDLAFVELENNNKVDVAEETTAVENIAPTDGDTVTDANEEVTMESA